MRNPGRLERGARLGGLAVVVATVSVLAGAVVDAAGRDQRLVAAARAGDVAKVRTLLKQGIDVNERAPDGATPLLWAVQANDVEVAGLLIRAGAAVDAANDYGVTPLSMACTNGSAPMVRTLLAAGAEPTRALPTGETPLMTAAFTGNLEVVRVLLDRGVDVDARESRHGQSALMWAVANNHVDVVRLLIERGADVRAKAASGFTPIMFAARDGNLETVKLLHSHGADASGADEAGNSVLHVAVVRGHVEVAEFLLSVGADPNADGPGYTALHWASWIAESMMTRDYRLESGEWSTLGGASTREGKMRLLRALLAKGAQVNARLRKDPPRFGSTFARAMLGGGSYVGGTPFFLAAMVGDTEVMQILLAHGADPLLGTREHTTPLMVAAGLATQEEETSIPPANRLEAVKLCLQVGGDVKASNDMGNTALHATAFLGFDAIADYLIERGAEVNRMNLKGETPLKIALGFSQQAQLYVHESTARLLRSRGGVTEGPVALPCGTCGGR